VWRKFAGSSGGQLQRRIVDIAHRPRRVEACRDRLVKRGSPCEPRRKVRVGDEQLAERDSVGRSQRQRLLRRFPREPLIGDIGAAELRLELRTETVGTDGLS
jgi:hypothetical protein